MHSTNLQNVWKFILIIKFFSNITLKFNRKPVEKLKQKKSNTGEYLEKELFNFLQNKRSGSS